MIPLLLSLALTGAAAQTWTDLAPIPVGTVQEHSTVLFRTSPPSLAVIGGLLPNGSTSRNLLLYDIPTDAWSHGASLPLSTGLNHPNTAVCNGRIYLLGGLTGAWPWPPSGASAVYNPDTNTWRALASIPAGLERGSAATAVHNGIIYLVGGLAAGPGPTVDSVIAYNVTADAWITTLPAAAAKLPEGRDHMAYAQLGSQLFVLGGRKDGGDQVKDTVFVLDLADLNGGWTTRAGRMPTARGGVTGAAVGRVIYTFGGEGNPAPGSNGVFNETEAYDVDADVWTQLPPMKLPRHGTSAVAVGGKVYVPGGGIVMGAGGTGTFDVFVP